MPEYKSILVVHPAAIGDAVMGTAVARTLRRHCPGARIIYLTHASLFPILELCGAIDIFLEWSRHSSLRDMAQAARQHQPELVIDLVGSLRTRLFCLLFGKKTLTYPKDRSPGKWRHVVDNYLATLEPLGLDQSMFEAPVLNPPPALIEELDEREWLQEPAIAIVPGVGKHRPNRAWSAENWAQLAAALHERYRRRLVLVGGPDDEAACVAVEKALGHKCVNLAGKMSLVQTTALLSRCEFVVSADTGPAHIAAAVGKDVICLMGPTAPERTGPYRMEAIGINRFDQCACRMAKACRKAAENETSACMQTISVAEVLERVLSVHPPVAPPAAISDRG